jgi:hypothetical protein
MIIQRSPASASADALSTGANNMANCFEVIPPRKWLQTRTIKFIRAPAATPNLLVIFICKRIDFGATPNSLILNNVLLFPHSLREKVSKSSSSVLSMVMNF